jgi:hypothetical protein
MSDRDLEELLGRIPVPAYDVRDDVDRGTTRLRRRGVTLSAAGLVLTATVGTALMLQGGTGAGAAPEHAGQPTITATPETSAPTRLLPPVESPSYSPTGLLAEDEMMPEGEVRLRQWREVLAEHLGDEVRYARNRQSAGDSLGSKYDWAGGGMLQLMVGQRWGDILGFVNPGPLDRLTFRGLQARTWADGSDVLVSLRHPDGTVVSLYASTSFGNNGTSTDSPGLSETDLLDAAADPRLRLH